MGKTFRAGVGLLAAATLVLGASGCGSQNRDPQSANKGDAIACSTFNLAYRGALNPPEPKEDEEENFVTALFDQAAAQATSPELAEDITRFTVAYSALTGGEEVGEEWNEDLEHTVNEVVSSYLAVGKFCEQEGVTLDGLEDLKEEIAQSR